MWRHGVVDEVSDFYSHGRGFESQSRNGFFRFSLMDVCVGISLKVGDESHPRPRRYPTHSIKGIRDSMLCFYPWMCR